MKKSIAIGAAAALYLMAFTPASFADHVESLRGANPVEHESNMVDIKQVQDERRPIQRDYVQQPPLIPHRIEGYKINKKFNKCLTCHSWANYQKYGATKISQTHFADRQNNVHANVAARRYFCTQCHVPQANAKPLVENEFKPLPTVHH